MNSIKSKNILAIFLLFFFIFHSTFQIVTFGFEQGTYFWFCNLSLLLGAIAIFLKRKDLVITLLSVLLPTQFFWALDHTKRALTGADFFGLTEALYHPGVSTLGFLVGHYHYFLIPTLFYSLPYLTNRKPELLKTLVLLVVVFFPLSYALFPAEQNINCIRESCFDTLPFFEGKEYLAIYGAVLFLTTYATGHFLSQKLAPLKLTTRTNQILFLVFLVLGSVFTSLGYLHKRKLPSFSCKTPYEDNTIRVQCKFITEQVSEWMALHYELKNKTRQIQECASYIEFEGKKELFQNGLTVNVEEPLKEAILIHYPSKDTAIQLTAVCQPLLR